ncbi:MAG: EI24 domain-containing protein [Bdellovibrionaceae bacterium]|nr:EI24 domain-containing protein [Pseudobdellovibrionaceae bacterium]
MADFVRGFGIPFKGALLVFTSFRLFLLAILPFWICFFSAIYFIWAFWNSSFSIVPYLMDWVPGLYRFTEKLKIGEFSLIAALAQGMFWFFLLIFVSYFSYVLLCIIGAPFYSLLADIILARKGLQLKVKNSFFRWLYTTIRMLIISVIKITFFMGLSFILFIISFFTFGMFIVPIFISLMVSYDCMDFSFECVTMSLRQRLAYFFDHFPLFLGLAMSILVVSIIPGLFTLILPFFIAGGANAFADKKNLENHEQRALT